MKTLATVLLLILSFNSLATEVDNFSQRYEPMADSLDVLNDKANADIDEAIFEVNEKNTKLRNSWRKKKRIKGVSCDQDLMLDAVQKRFTRFLVSKFEKYIVANEELDKRHPKKDSVYKYFSVWQKSFSTVNIPGFTAPILNMSDMIIGADKFSHFFHEGWNYFKRVKYKNMTIKEAIEAGEKAERSFWGLYTTGVYAYADLYANYQGYLFYNRLVKEVKGKKAYLSCDSGVWTKEIDFDFRDFFNDGFDEAVNCSNFKSDINQARFDKRIAELEEETGMPMACPVKPQSCSDLKKTMTEEEAVMFLHPKCREIN